MSQSIESFIPAYYEVVKTCNRKHYDDYGSDTFNTQIGISTSVDDLRTRWNKHVDAEFEKVKDKHESYHKHLPVKIELDSLYANWHGSTGGGCSRVDYSVAIKPVDQLI